MAKLVLPNLGEGIEQATITFWFYKVGDQVKDKEDVVELTTDKATFNLPSPCAGKVTEIIYNEGDTVKVGDTIAVIEEA